MGEKAKKSKKSKKSSNDYKREDPPSSDSSSSEEEVEEEEEEGEDEDEDEDDDEEDDEDDDEEEDDEDDEEEDDSKKAIKRPAVAPTIDPKRSKIKKAKNAWQLFSANEMRGMGGARTPGVSTSKMSEASAKWKSMTPSEKQKWEDLANEDKTRFNDEMEEEGFGDEVSITWDGQKKPRSAYSLYLVHAMAKLKKNTEGHFQVTEASKQISAKWKDEKKKAKWGKVFEEELKKFDEYLSGLSEKERLQYDKYQNQQTQKRKKPVSVAIPASLPKTPYLYWCQAVAGNSEYKSISKQERLEKWNGLTEEERNKYKQEHKKLIENNVVKDTRDVWQFQKRGLPWFDLDDGTSLSLTKALESSKNDEEQKTKLRISDLTYIVNFQNMTLMKKEKPSKALPLRRINILC